MCVPCWVLCRAQFVQLHTAPLSASLFLLFICRSFFWQDVACASRVIPSARGCGRTGCGAWEVLCSLHCLSQRKAEAGEASPGAAVCPVQSQPATVGSLSRLSPEITLFSSVVTFLVGCLWSILIESSTEVSADMEHYTHRYWEDRRTGT